MFEKKIMVGNYSTVIDSDSRDVLKSNEFYIRFTIDISDNQLNMYNYTKRKRIVTEPMISSIKLITI